MGNGSVASSKDRMGVRRPALQARRGGRSASPAWRQVAAAVCIVGMLTGAALVVGSRIPAAASQPTASPNSPRELAAPSWAAPRLSSAHRVVPVSSVSAGGVDDWPMLDQNPGRTGDNPLERTLSPSNATALRLLWENNTTGPVESSLAAVNGTLYFGAWDGNGVYAFNASSGTRDWTAKAGGAWRPGSPAIPGHGVCYQGIPGSGIHQAWAGITSTPEYWNGTVYVGGANNTLFAMNGSPGPMPLSQRIEWTLGLANFSSGAWQEHYVWSSPLIYRGFLYIGEATGCEGPMVGQLLQINLTSHQLAHIFNASNTTDWGDSIWSSPAVDPVTNTIWTTTGNEYQLNCSTVNPPYARALIALNATNVSDVLGHWQEPTTCADDDFGAGATLFTASNGTPMVAAVNKDGTGYAFYQSSFRGGGTVSSAAWTVGLSSFDEAPAAFDGTDLYFGDNGQLKALHANGTLAWGVGTPGFTQAGLTTADGLLVAAIDWSNYTGASLQVRNASNGALLYHFDFPGQQVNGEPVVADGRIFCASGPVSLNGTGHIYAFGVPIGATATDTLLNGSTSSFAFHANATGGMPPYSFSWDFGDGSPTASGAYVVHRYTAAGPFVTQWQATDRAGEAVNGSLSVTAVPATGTGSVSRTPVDEGVDVWFNVSTSEPIAVVSWTDLPPGCPKSNSSELQCQPNTTGVFLPAAAVTTVAGDMVDVVLPVLAVNPALQAAPKVTPAEGERPLVVSFDSQITGGTLPYSGQWDFGDGNTSTALTTSHTYTAPGTYPVGFAGQDAGGGAVLWHGSIQVAPPLSANFTSTLVQAGCLGGQPWNELELNATGYGGFPPYSFAWSTSNGTATGSEYNLTLSYGQSPSVVLTVHDVTGASSTLGQNVTMSLPPCPHPKGPPGGGTGASGFGWPWWLIPAVGAAGAVSLAVVLVWARRRRSRRPRG